MANSSVLIAIGSNMGDRHAYILQAIERINLAVGPVTKTSTMIETAPMGAADELFLNGALICTTELEPHDCLDTLLGIEEELGRVRTVHWGNRTIDLDILLYQDDRGSRTINNENLTLPHPQMLFRDFVMVPATEIAPDWIHPVARKGLKELIP